MFDFKRIRLLCLEIRLSKHKMTIISKHLCGTMALLASPGYAYGLKWARFCKLSKFRELFYHVNAGDLINFTMPHKSQEMRGFIIRFSLEILWNRAAKYGVLPCGTTNERKVTVSLCFRKSWDLRSRTVYKFYRFCSSVKKILNTF